MKIKLFIFAAFVLGMIQIAVLNFIPKPWIPAYYSFSLLIDIIVMFISFNYIDKHFKS